MGRPPIGGAAKSIRTALIVGVSAVAQTPRHPTTEHARIRDLEEKVEALSDQFQDLNSSTTYDARDLRRI